jgi:exonuclease VII large subunit
MLNTTAIEARIKLNESSITIAICSKTFNSENMSYMTSLSLKCQSFSSSKHRRRSHTRILKRHILKMSEKTSDINQSVNQLINQLSQSFNQLISRHQSFRSHSGKHLFNHHILNHYTLNYHTIHHTVQSISFIISTIDHHTHQSINTHFSNHPDYHTSAIKFDLSRKHLNRIYLNHRNHLHLHRHSHQHLKLSSNRFTSVNHSMNRVNHSMTRMIDSDN